MNQENRAVALWKELTQGIRTHKAGVIVAGLGGVLTILLAAFADTVRLALRHIVDHYLQPTIYTAMLGALAFAVDKWLGWKKLATLALERASKVELLEKELEEVKSKIPSPTDWKARYAPHPTSEAKYMVFRLKREFRAADGDKFICPFCWDEGIEKRLKRTNSHHYQCSRSEHEKLGTFLIDDSGV
jgi:hypothetical protein